MWQTVNNRERQLLADDDGLTLPPIAVASTPITIQPTTNDDTMMRFRDNVESLQIRDSGANDTTPDWVSSNRLNHMSVFSGIFFLSSVQQLEMQAVVDINFLLGLTRSGNQYRIKVPGAETLFLAVEDSREYQRRFFGSSRQLTLNIMDPLGESAFVIRKSISCGCVPGFLHNITVETNELIGSVEQNFTLFGISLTVYDEERKALCYIEGPILSTCCMSAETQFQIVSTDRSRQIASLIRHWDNVIVDSSTLLTFPLNTSVKLKGLLIGAAFLLEFLYFKNQRRFLF